jgi:hypothetical protein
LLVGMAWALDRDVRTAGELGTVNVSDHIEERTFGVV